MLLLAFIRPFNQHTQIRGWPTRWETGPEGYDDGRSIMQAKVSVRSRGSFSHPSLRMSLLAPTHRHSIRSNFLPHPVITLCNLNMHAHVAQLQNPSPPSPSCTFAVMLSATRAPSTNFGARAFLSSIPTTKISPPTSSTHSISLADDLLADDLPPRARPRRPRPPVAQPPSSRDSHTAFAPTSSNQSRSAAVGLAPPPTSYIHKFARTRRCTPRTPLRLRLITHTPTSPVA